MMNVQLILLEVNLKHLEIPLQENHAITVLNSSVRMEYASSAQNGLLSLEKSLLSSYQKLKMLGNFYRIKLRKDPHQFKDDHLSKVQDYQPLLKQQEN